MLNPADASFLETLRARLPEGVIRAPEPRHLEDPRGRIQGIAGAVALPNSTAEVAEILRSCSEARVGVLPWGGGTGLVGGQLMEAGPLPLVLSLERMKAIRAIYPEENVVIAEAGVTLADLRAAAAEAGRMFPLSLAAEGSCTIGGNLATNAGGVNVLRYGNTRDLCLGVEAVLADGRILKGLKRLRKDNTGYDIRNLMIGSEGTLGVITAASLRMVARPPETGVALMVVESPAAALQLLALAEEQVSGCVSAFELISGMALKFLAATTPELRQPFAETPDWLVLVELGLPRGLQAPEVLETLFVAGAEAGLVSDGVIAQSETQRNDFWNLREHIPEANRRIGAVSSHDVSLPLSELPRFLARADRELAALGDFRINAFGHLGDGNLHYNVFPAEGLSRGAYDDRREAVKDLVHAIVDDMGGSVSAEHGLGRLKTKDLERYGDPVRVAVMRGLKAGFDPLGILNPGAVLA